MKFSLTKLKAAFGDSKNMGKLHADGYTQNIINDIKDEPFAVGAENVCYAGIAELGGYHFLQTIIVGSFHIKTIKGAQLTINGKDFKMVMTSDMEELESEHSDVSNRSITRIDFAIEKEDIAKFKKSNIDSLLLEAKKHRIPFDIYKPSKEA
ncbi:hypothetical protein [Mangrovimonas sp. DI 80]|uniref:hypothetical protein n=1 Tax=Mangrovimonas sp. DI 80 TaxID=1779330 RepID=UPI0009766268|nr:hypothetical protein [Mangrovimonas sp. DI 80]OMP31191.1 hypothetical protein BKM32_09020 [Mangrovimonas sp. DI 80]